MHNTHHSKYAVHLALGLFSGLALVSGGSFVFRAPAAIDDSPVYMANDTTLQASATSASHVNLPPLTVSQARKLAERLERDHGFSPPIDALAAALQERNTLLSRQISVHIEPVIVDASVPPPPVEDTLVTVQAHPAWLVLEATKKDAHYRIDPNVIAADLALFLPESVKPPVNAVVTAVEEHDSNNDVLRAHIDTHAAPGYLFDPSVLGKTIATALDEGQSSVNLPLPWKGGSVSLTMNGETTELQLLSSGRSNFAGSTWGRKVNIRNGLDKRFDGTLVPQNATVSFNDTIGPISYKRGWADALIIVDGWKLEPLVGGGLCQVATTVYRSVLLAGLPIEERKAHSLYVSYYKDYGVGLDATVQPTLQDLVFKNDTPGYVLFQSWTDGDDAYVNAYGIPDGRTVALEGPYFAKTVPDSFVLTDKYGNRRSMKNSEIGWIHTVRYTDGSENRNQITSIYNKGIPLSSLLAEYPNGEYGTELMHAVAPKKNADAAL